MKKKYLIIMIAACLVCLGTGIAIGVGIGRNNLTVMDGRQPAALNNAIMPENIANESLYENSIATASLFHDYVNLACEMEDGIKEVKAKLVKIRNKIDERSFVITDEIINDMHDIQEFGYGMYNPHVERFSKSKREIFRAFQALYLATPIKPGSMEGTSWFRIESALEDILKELRDMADVTTLDLQKFYQEYQAGVSTVPQDIKREYDDAIGVFTDIKELF